MPWSGYGVLSYLQSDGALRGGRERSVEKEKERSDHTERTHGGGNEERRAVESINNKSIFCFA